tara:strand:- start:87690 stop:88619 length:930 start_codon:yes stop_codon:yes gene_type:complete
MKKQEFTFKAMGGHFQLTIFNDSYDECYVDDLFKLCELEVKRIEDKLSDFKESPFQLINKYSGKREVHVDDETFDIISKSIDISKKSYGLFDISFASVGHAWRKAKEEGRELSFFDKFTLKHLIDYRKIKINNIEKTIFLPHRKMKIGLGGIGKGYAVDCLYHLILGKGVENFLVNGEGDIRVHSAKNALRKWKLGIQNPFSSDSSKSIGIVQLTNGSISSSGGYVNNIKGKKDDHHIIHPSKGSSYNRVVASTVIANDTVTTDTTATILMNMKPQEAIDYLNKNQLAGLVVDRSGKVLLSQIGLSYFG